MVALFEQLVVGLEGLVLVLTLGEVLLVHFKLVLEEVDQLFTSLQCLLIERSVIHSLLLARAHPFPLWRSDVSRRAHPFLVLADLELLALYHLLAEMRPLRKLFLHVLVDLDLPLKRFNLIKQLIVLRHNNLRLLTLEFQLVCKLIVLEHGEPGSLSQLFVIKCK